MALETLKPDKVEVVFARHGAQSMLNYGCRPDVLAGPLIALASETKTYIDRGCLLALSGILSEQVDDVLGAYSSWIEFEQPVFRKHGGQTWARLTGRRIEG